MGAKAIKLGFFFFFSEYACVTFWNNTSFSFIHQAGNIPSHLFHIIIVLFCFWLFSHCSGYGDKLKINVFCTFSNQTERRIIKVLHIE